LVKPIEAALAMAAEAGIETALGTGKQGSTIDAPVMRSIPDGLKFIWENDGLEMKIESPEPDHRVLDVEVTVELDVAGEHKPRPLLAPSRMNIKSLSAKENLSRMLTRKIDRDWGGRIEQVSALCQEFLPAGEPMVWLNQVEDPGPPEYHLKPVLERGEHTVIYATRGSTKSMFGLATLISVADGLAVLPSMKAGNPVRALVLDWETNKQAHRRRYGQLLAGIGQDKLAHNIGYKHMSSPLSNTVTEIRKLVAEHNIELIMADSGGMAVGGQISDEQAVLAYFAATRRIGGTWLTITHTPKTGATAIGSQYWESQPSGVWEMVKDQEESENTVSCALINRKSRDDQMFAPLSFRLEFGNGHIRYRYADPTTTPEIERKLKPRARTIALLKQENRPLTVREVAEGLDLPEKVVRNTLDSGTGKVFIRKSKSRPYTFGLMASSEIENNRLLKTSTQNSTVKSDNPPPKGGEGFGSLTLPDPSSKKQKPEVEFEDEERW